MKDELAKLIENTIWAHRKEWIYYHQKKGEFFSGIQTLNSDKTWGSEFTTFRLAKILNEK